MTVTEPQIWTTIGVLSAALVGTITLVSTMLMRTIHLQFDSLSRELSRGLTGLRSEMIARFESVNSRLDGLDRDVNALTLRVFGGD